MAAQEMCGGRFVAQIGPNDDGSPQHHQCCHNLPSEGWLRRHEQTRHSLAVVDSGRINYGTSLQAGTLTQQERKFP